MTVPESGRVLQIRPDTANFPPGDVVAAVSLVDESMRTVVRTALRAGCATDLQLPGPGRYLLTGTTPAGGLLHTELDAKRRTPTVIDMPDSQLGPGGSAGSPGSLPPPDRAELYWNLQTTPVPIRKMSKGWQPDDRFGAPDSEPPPCLLALQGPEADLRVMTVVPTGRPVSLVPLPSSGAPAWSVLPAPGTALTLLGYLHAGKIPEAVAVAEVAMADMRRHQDRTPDPLVDLATARLLLLRGDPRMRQWITELNEQSPFRLDARVLTWELLRRTPGADALPVALEIMRMAEIGLPVLSDSMRSLVRCLNWGVAVKADVFEYAAGRMNDFQRSEVPGIFMAYTARTPATPERAAGAPEDWYRADISAMVGEAAAAQGGMFLPRPTRPVGPSAPSDRALLGVHVIPERILSRRRVMVAAATASAAVTGAASFALFVGANSSLQNIGFGNPASLAIAAVCTVVFAVVFFVFAVGLRIFQILYRGAELRRRYDEHVRDDRVIPAVRMVESAVVRVFSRIGD